MKKYTYFNPRWVLVGMVIPFLLFVFAMNSAYAYFTSVASDASDSSETAIIKIGFTNETSTKIYEKSTQVLVNDVLPGHTVEASGGVQNVGNVPFYALLKCQIMVGETVLDVLYLTPSGEEIVHNGTNYTTTASLLNANTTVNFNVDHEFNFYEYWNEDQGKTITFKFNAYAIQTTYLTDNDSNTASVATEILMNSATKNASND